MPVTPTEAERASGALTPLVEAARGGDREAFGHLVARFATPVFALARSRVRERSAAEDVVQEVFLRAWERLGELREPERVGSWLCGITVRVAGDVLRKRARAPGSLDRMDGVEPVARDAGEGRARTIDALTAHVDELPEKLREVIHLKYMKKWSYQEMADFLGISRPGVNARLQKARRLLRERMAAAGAAWGAEA